MSHTDNRWFPPSPHKEEILRRIEAGRCHIQERGHNVPPLLVFEDGGVIELSRVRYQETRRGMELVADSQIPAEGVTQFNDVCGTVDEMKGILQETPERAEADPKHFDRLLDDALYMISRMNARCEAYMTFTTGLRELLARMEELAGPDPDRAKQNAEKLRGIIRNEPGTIPSRLEEVFEAAEEVRDVAQKLEDTLGPFKKAAIEVSGLYESVRGGRTWAEPPLVPGERAGLEQNLLP